MNFSDALLLVAIATAAPGPSADLAISGPATVIDGDTIVVQGKHIRLFGIDAPESNQRCTGADRLPYNCGGLATSVLEEEIGGAVVNCFVIDVDQYRRLVGVCAANGHDLGEQMVRLGYAIDYVFFSGGRYGEAQEEARAAKRGMWAGQFIEPREWRRGVR